MISYDIKKCSSFSFIDSLDNYSDSLDMLNDSTIKKYIISETDYSNKNQSKQTNKIETKINKIDMYFKSVDEFKTYVNNDLNSKNKSLLFVELGLKKQVLHKNIYECDDTDIIKNYHSMNKTDSNNDNNMFISFMLELYKHILNNEKIEEYIEKYSSLSPEYLYNIINLFKQINDGRLKELLIQILINNHEPISELVNKYPIRYIEQYIDDIVTSEPFSDIKINSSDEAISSAKYKHSADHVQKQLNKNTVAQLEAFSRTEFAVIYGKQRNCFNAEDKSNINYDIINSLYRNGVPSAPDTGELLSMHKLMKTLSLLNNFSIVFIHPALLMKYESEYPNTTEPVYTIGKGEITAVAYRYLIINFFPYMSMPSNDIETEYLF